MGAYAVNLLRMLKTIALTFLFFLFLGPGLSATAQQPSIQQQTRHAYKLAKKLAHYTAGTKLDVKLSNGDHHVGTLGEAGSGAFVLSDPVTGKSETLSYQDVKRVRPIRMECSSNQSCRTRIGPPPVVSAGLIISGLFVLLIVLH